MQGPPVACLPADLCANKTCAATECQYAGICTMGMCSNATAKPNGTLCSSGACLDGQCVGELQPTTATHLCFISLRLHI